MKLWLGDIRDPVNYGKPDWVWAKTALEALSLIKTGKIVEMSLDHDLGTDPFTGYDLACWVEELAWTGEIPSIKWDVHSDNPVGKKRMIMALEKADIFWDQKFWDTKEYR